MAAAGRGFARRALRLFGAAEARLGVLGVQHNVPFWTGLIDRYLAEAQEQLGADAATASEEGRRMPFERAIVEALHPS